jgi:hypothetical protein
VTLVTPQARKGGRGDGYSVASWLFLMESLIVRYDVLSTIYHNLILLIKSSDSKGTLDKGCAHMSMILFLINLLVK